MERVYVYVWRTRVFIDMDNETFQLDFHETIYI